MLAVWPKGLASAATAALVLLCSLPGHAADVGLELETKIPLADVRGRIDHFAVDAGLCSGSSWPSSATTLLA